MSEGASGRIFSGVLWSIIVNVVNAVYGFIAIPILISNFGKAEYGLIGIAQSVNAYMQLMDMGLNATNVRFFSLWIHQKNHSKVQKLFSTCNAFYGVVGIINAIALTTLALFAERIFNVNAEQGQILKNLLTILSVAAIVNWATSCFNQIIQASENVAWTQKRQLVSKFLLILALVLTIHFKLSITLYFFLTILAYWLILPFVVKKIKEVAPFVKISFSFDIRVLKEILPYSLNVFSFSIFSLTFQNLRSVFLGIEGTMENVTEFAIINGVTNLIAMVSGVFMSSLLPTTSRIIADGNKENYYRVAYQGTKFITVFLGFCIFGLICCGRDLIIVYVGADFLNIILWLNVMLLLQISNHILAISSLILGGADIKPLSRMTAVSSIIALIVAWFTIPHYGVGGTVISSVIYTALQQIYYYTYYWPRVMKINSLKILFTILLPVLLIGAAIYIVINMLPIIQNTWISMIVSASVFIALYIPSIYLYLGEADKSFLKNVILKR